MQKLTSEELRNYFKTNNYFLRTGNGIEILAQDVKERGVAGELSLTLPVDAGEEDKVLIDLVMEYITMEAFIEEACISSIGDLQHIKPSFCWSRYIKGNGIVNCTVKALDGASICFRVQHGETIVYSTDLHYYDELAHALSIPQQFIQYIEERMERLGTYAALGFEKVGFETL